MEGILQVKNTNVSVLLGKRSNNYVIFKDSLIILIIPLYPTLYFTYVNTIGDLP